MNKAADALAEIGIPVARLSQGMLTMTMEVPDYPTAQVTFIVAEDKPAITIIANADHRLTSATPAPVYRYIMHQAAEPLRGGVGVGCVGETDVISCFCVVELDGYGPGRLPARLLDVLGQVKALEQAHHQKGRQANQTASGKEALFGPMPTYAFSINRAALRANI